LIKNKDKKKNHQSIVKENTQSSSTLRFKIVGNAKDTMKETWAHKAKLPHCCYNIMKET